MVQGQLGLHTKVILDYISKILPQEKRKKKEKEEKKERERTRERGRWKQGGQAASHIAAENVK